jgi:hypothetical protein
VKQDYYRRDQQSGISPPDLSKAATYAEHITRARGKRTQFTSVTLDLIRNRDFGESSYRLRRPEVDDAGHLVVQHRELLDCLRQMVRQGKRDDRSRAVVALSYARRRGEGLVDWRFHIVGVDRKDLIEWVRPRVQTFFERVH